MGEIMEKRFFDVFRDLRLSDDEREMLEQAGISRITMNASKDQMQIYLESDRLIGKQIILSAEEAIQTQIFSDSKIRVNIIERFRLSKTYNARNLMDLYRDSILLELREYSIFLYDLFRKASMVFPDQDTMHLRLPDTCVTAGHLKELTSVLEKIFTWRCGVDLKLETELIPAGESENMRLSRLRMEQEAQQIARRYRELSAEGNAVSALDGADMEIPEMTNGTPEPNKTGKTETVRSKPKKDPAVRNKRAAAEDISGGSIRRSSNPDVIYGRDVEDDAIPLEQIVGEMGEVTVRGQIRSLEFRQIRGERTIVMIELTDLPTLSL